MKTIKEILAECKGEEDFKPHMMYDPKTGKGYKADTYADHVKMDKMGYTHEKPEIKEDFNPAGAIMLSYLAALTPFFYMAGKGMMKELGLLKSKAGKKGFKPSKEDKGLLQKFMDIVKRKKPQVVKDVEKKANESVELEEAKSSSGYELYHRDFSGAMQHAYAHAKKKGFIVDKDDVDHKVAMGPKRPSSGKTNKYILDTNKKQKLHVQVANLDNKRYELNMYIESVQLDESVISDVKDIVAKKQAKKIQGVMVDLFTASAISQIYDKVNDGNKAKMDKMKVTQLANAAMKLMKREDFIAENARAKRDAMSAMGKRGKDSADIDTDATDDDRKAASKNVLMQIRKLSDLPKGGEIEFENGKKGKISQDDAGKVVKLFNTLKKPQDKAKFQKVISKDLKTIQGLLKRLGR